jgi:hypothetical protein
VPENLTFSGTYQVVRVPARHGWTGMIMTGTDRIDDADMSLKDEIFFPEMSRGKLKKRRKWAQGAGFFVFNTPDFAFFILKTDIQ